MLQDTKGNIILGKRQTDGTLLFAFSLKVKEGKNRAQPVFTGRPVDDRFVHLIWFAIDRGDYIN
jgi:hypothetical protein